MRKMSKGMPTQSLDRKMLRRMKGKTFTAKNVNVKKGFKFRI